MTLAPSPKAKFRAEAARFGVIVFASALMAFTYRTFVEWGDLYPPGVTGLSVLLQRIFQKAFDGMGFDISIPFAPINFILNAVPVWVGFKYVGKRFTLQSLYVIFFTGLFTDIMPVETVTSFISPQELETLKAAPFVMSIFGGIVFGFGMALCLRWNATTGGTDFIAIYLSERKGRETWNLILGFNAAVLVCAGFCFGWLPALYSIVFQFVSTQVLHLMYRTYQYQTLLIVTTHPGRICEAIYRISHHGATVVPARGGFIGQDRSLVFSVVAADDTPRIYALCKSNDENAFITTISTSRVIGRFYMRPRD